MVFLVNRFRINKLHQETNVDESRTFLQTGVSIYELNVDNRTQINIKESESFFRKDLKINRQVSGITSIKKKTFRKNSYLSVSVPTLHIQHMKNKSNKQIRAIKIILLFTFPSAKPNKFFFANTLISHVNTAKRSKG